MKNILKAMATAILLTVNFAHAGWFTATDSVDLKKFQPAIVSQEVPMEVRGWSPDAGVMRFKLEPLNPVVASYNGEGDLIASWNPNKNAGVAPTIIVLHGGHGIGPSEMSMARWAFDTLGANVLVLDSFWSRGISENWKTETQFGANMRVLDLIAAARFVRSEVGPQSPIFAVGGSQGGWTVLRAFTESNPLSSEVRELFKGGVSMYPFCRSNQAGRDDTSPRLGTKYALPLILLTGGKDEATDIRACDQGRIVKPATKWIHFEDATHGWDAPLPRNMPVGSEFCVRAQNVYLRFPICHNPAAIEVTRKEIADLVAQYSKD